MAITDPAIVAQPTSVKATPTSPVGAPASPVGDPNTETTTKISTTTTTPNPSSFTERAAEPETARGGGGVQDQNPKFQDSDQESVTLATTEQNPVSQEEAQTAATPEKRRETASENQNPVASAEEVEEQRPELAYPVKLTEREREDIAAQVHPLPPEVAQQMLDVVEAKIGAGQIRTSAAAVLRGITRKYRQDPASFDPSTGFKVADIRRRREEAEARLRLGAERRERELEREPPCGVSPEAREIAHRSIASMLRGLRGRGGK